jgi:hypothetical protein
VARSIRLRCYIHGCTVAPALCRGTSWARFDVSREMTEEEPRRGRKRPLGPPDPEVVRAWVERTRAAQGLPKHIEAPVVIARIAAIFRLAREGELRRQARLKSVGTKRGMSSR